MLIRRQVRLIAMLVCSCMVPGSCPAQESPSMPEFGKGTVLVWEVLLQDVTREFVVRIARFTPDRLIEWEDMRSQGTVLILNRDLLEAGGYLNKKLFMPGKDTKSDHATTLWLSRKTYRTLKEKQKAQCKIDQVPGRMNYVGDGKITVEVDGSPTVLPIMIVQDDRGSEKWFLDQEDNPLMMKNTLRQYAQTLVSITTNQPDALRWLKGKKLQRLLAE